ncbi:hypothetical protein [Phenylobacterium sp.]|uniref:hypothetical protein n=1 Tax=Phenylobacterium sp. TaxID=1871053 RepID=UPI002BC08B3B|nr:hypothetical protein [Phenylobacterium sp.]HLZ75303.1 hypothetical protein [Phenylobacterium sp.]
MLKIAICAATALLLTSPARAQTAGTDEAAAVRDFLSGTWEIDVPAGDWSAKYYLAADHTFRETGSDGEVRGTWELKDGKLCTTADHLVAPDRIKTYCNKGVGKHAGEQWTDADPVTGNTVFFTLKAGR